MKKRRLFQSVRLLFVAMISTLIGAVAVACDKKDEVTELTPGPESGLYYCDAEGVDYVFTLFNGNQFTLTLDDLFTSGIYTVTDDAIELNFSKKLDETVTATLADNAIVVTYKNSEIRFLKKINFTVVYDSKEGSEVASATVINGKTLEAPTTPTREGYIFIGWFNDESYTSPFMFGTQPVTSNMKLYAQWVPVSPNGSEYTVKFDLNYEGATALDSMQTVGGQLLNAPAPAREGYTFGGWYFSANNSGDALTYPVANNTFTADTTVYAFWKAATDETKFASPVVTITNTQVSWEAVLDANDYEVSVTAPDGSVTTRTVTSTSYAYNFDEGAAGDYVVSVKVKAKGTKAESDATVRYYKNKALDRVTGFSVVNDTLVFSGVANAENYYVTIDCGNEDHDHTMYDIGDATTYNFSACKMQEGGIKFTVTATANGYASSTSETYVYNRILAPVSGFYIVEETQLLKWDAVPYATNYFVSVRCGNSAHEHVLVNNGSNTSFSLKECSPADGGIVINVYPSTEGYNSPAASTYTYNKTMLASPYGITVEGNVLSWKAVQNATSYEIVIGDTTLSSTTNSIDLSDQVELVVAADYKLRVKALGANASSLWSDTFDARYYAMEDSLKYKASVVSWKPVIGVTSYEVSVNGTVAANVENGATSVEIMLTQAGTNTISVRPYDAVMARFLDAVSIDVYAYTFTFDSRLGSGVDSIYLAAGDKIPEFVASARDGYEFAGWYNLPGGPSPTNKKYDNQYFNAYNDMIVYAYWTPAVYNVVYDLDGGACDNTGNNATYLSDYQWDIPTNDDATVVFGGWYSAEHGNGTRYTDENGKSIAPWSEITGGTAYAYWVQDILSFTLNLNGTYNVQAGTNISRVSSVKIPATVKDENGQDVKVTHIGGYAFASCTSLVKISIPNTIVSIDVKTAFGDCKKLQEIEVYEVSGNNAVRYSSSDGALVYFDEQEQLTRIFFPAAKGGSFRIPDGVSVIPIQAFASSLLEEIIIPASVQRIDTKAFYSCKKLKNVVFEEGAAGGSTLTIAENAFSYCSLLESVTLPAHFVLEKDKNGNLVTDATTGVSVSLKAFSNCAKLSSIDVSKNNAEISAVGGVVCDKSGTVMYYCPKGRTGAYTIPNGVTEIGAYAFDGCKYLTSITVPNHVTKIGNYAFRDCDKVRVLTFKGGAVVDMTVGNYAFYNLDMLETIVFEEGSRVAYLGIGAFGYAKKLTDLTIPDSMREIGKQAFMNCTALRSVTFAEDGQDLSFGDKAFLNCTGITEIRLPASVQELSLSVFDGCSGIMKVTVDPNNQKYTDIDGVLFTKDKSEILFYGVGRSAESYTLPAETTAYGATSFKNNPYLKSVIITANIVKIGDSAFYGCTKLSELVFEAAEAELEIGSCAFQNCSALTSVELPARLKKIGDHLFDGATSLTNVTSLASGLTYVGGYAFYKTVITAFNVPDTVTYIGTYAFAYTALTEINLPDNLETLGSYAFCDTNLTSVTVPGNLKTKITNPDAVTDKNDPYYGKLLGARVFSNCKQLKTVTLKSGNTYVSDWMFGGCDKLTAITIPNTVESIGQRAFSSCTALATVTFEKGGVKDDEGNTKDLIIGDYYKDGNGYIDGYAFYGCSSLTEIALPARTTILNGKAFYQCTSLTSVSFDELAEDGKTVVPGKLKFIGEQAFDGCTSLTSITIPKTVSNYDVVDNKTAQIIGLKDKAFNGCTALTTVTFEAGGTLDLTIGANAFSGCTALTTVTLPARLERAAGANSTVVEGLPVSAFSKCTALKELTMGPATGEEDSYSPDAGMYYSVIDGILYSDWGDRLVFCPQGRAGVVTVPKAVTLICNSAFDSCKEITEIKFENNAEGEKPRSLAIGSGTSATNVFRYCSGLEKIELPERLTYIGQSAFYFATSGTSISKFTSITIPSTVETIDKQAFYQCVSLNSLTFAKNSEGKSSLTKIADKAFYYSSITSAAIPASVTEIGTYAFAATSSYNYAYSKLTTLTFEQDGDGKSKLTKIGDYAFQHQKSLTNFTLPSSLTTIGKNVFQGCNELTEMVIPNEVTAIGADVFKDCANLKSITLSDKLKSSQTIYTIFGVTSTSTNAPTCTSLAEIKVNATSQNFCAVDGVLFNKKKTTLVYFPMANTQALDKDGGYTVPSGTATIDYASFQGTNITSVTIPESVTLIKDKAFYGAKQLTTVTFVEGTSKSALTIGDSKGYGAFEECSSIQTITFPKRLKKITKESFASSTDKDGQLTTINFATGTGVQLDTIEKGAFKYQINLESVTIPASVTKLSGFEYCTGLKEVKFEEGSKLSTLTASAFQGCTALETIELPSSLTKIENNALQTLNSLKSITIPKNVTEIGNYAFNVSVEGAGLEEVIFEEGSKLKTIGTAAFKGLTKLTSISLPTSVNKIGDDAFNGCAGLKTVTFGEGNVLASVGKSAFSGCASLESINISGGTIGNTAFSGCHALTNVTLGEGVTSLGNKAFYNCDKLKNIVIPASLETFAVASSASSAFEGCTALETVTFAEGSALAAIPAKTFYGCKSLESIVVPDSVESVGLSAFEGCEALKRVTLGANVLSIGDSAFSGCKELEQILLSPDLETIGAYAFEDCKKLTQLSIPSSVTSIGANPFKGCSGFNRIGVDNANINYATINDVLYEVDLSGDPVTLVFYPSLLNGEFTLPDTVTSFAAGAFANSSITEFVVPARITEIPDGIFENCKDLASVTLHSGITKIGANAFAGCASLSSITITESITSIGANAFKDCTSLTKLKLEGNKQGVLTIGANAFENCAFTSFNVGGTVKSLGDDALKNVPLTSVTFSEGIEEIGANMFKGNMSIMSLHLPSTLEVIGDSAFEGCTALTKITSAQDAVEKDSIWPLHDLRIGAGAFKDCTSLSSVYLPKRLKSESGKGSAIGNYAFAGCVSLSSVNFSEGNPDANYTVSYFNIGNYAFYGCSSLTSIVFPDSLRATTNSGGASSTTAYAAIGKYAFVGSGLKSVTFTDMGDNYATSSYKTVTVDNYAFYGLKSLTSVQFSEELYSLGDGAFQGTGVVNVTLPKKFSGGGSYIFANCIDLETVTFTSTTAIYDIEANMFDGCTALTTVTIPERSGTYGGLSYIYQYAFRNCTSLETISLPSTTKGIYAGAFENCSSLTSLELPAELTYVGYQVKYSNISKNPFIGCTKLELSVAEGSEKFKLIDGVLYLGTTDEDGFKPTELIYVSPKVTGEFAVPDTVTTIYAGAFAGCTGITSISIPASVTKITGNPFFDCSASVTIAAESESFSVIEGVLYGLTDGKPTMLIAVFASAGSEITVRNTVTDIAPYAFVGSSVTSVDMSGSAVVTIWHGAFEGVTTLTTVTFSDTLTTIYSNAFSGCTGLTTLDLPASLTAIWDYAFSGCTGITELTIPATVQYVYAGAFAGWTSAQTINVYYNANGAVSSYYYEFMYYNGATVVWSER